MILQKCVKNAVTFCNELVLKRTNCNREGSQLNPSTPMSDQDRISLYNINTKSRRQVMRTKKSINKGVIS